MQHISILRFQAIALALELFHSLGLQTGIIWTVFQEHVTTHYYVSVWRHRCERCQRYQRCQKYYQMCSLHLLISIAFQFKILVSQHIVRVLPRVGKWTFSKSTYMHIYLTYNLYNILNLLLKVCGIILYIANICYSLMII